MVPEIIENIYLYTYIIFSATNFLEKENRIL